MRFATVAAAVALFAGANAYNSTYVTEVLSSYVTYCPSATAITHNGETYSVTEATTLTITNCPCTITKPVVSYVVTSCLSSSSAPVAPYTNGTTPVYTPPAASGVASATGTGPAATFTGAANQAYAASGAGLAAVLGFAAYVL